MCSLPASLPITTINEGSSMAAIPSTSIHIDDIAICHLGDLGHTLQEEQLEEVADADVLLIPIGGQHTINATQAAEVSVRSSPAS